MKQYEKFKKEIASKNMSREIVDYLKYVVREVAEYSEEKREQKDKMSESEKLKAMTVEDILDYFEREI